MTLARSTALVSGLTFGGYLVGIAVQVVFALSFGAGPSTDAWFAAVARSPEVQGQLPYGRQRSGLAIQTPGPARLPGFHHNRRGDREHANTTRAGFRHHHQTVRGDCVDPAAEPMTGKVARARIACEIVKTREAAAEDEHVLRSGEHAAVMTRPGKTPRNFRAGERMNASLLLARMQIERPGFGNYPAPDDNRAMPVVGIF